MKILSCMFFLMLLIPALVSGQEVLEIVTFNKVKTRKIYPGEQLTYQTKEEPDRWYSGTLDRLDILNNKITVGLNTISIEDITAFREKAVIPGIVSKFMMISGLSSIIAIVFTPGIPTSQFVNWIYINAGVIIAGFTVDRVWRYKKIKFGNKRMLRLLDLTFYPHPEFER